MSIASLCSQPDKRRVKFSLPEAKLNLNNDKFRFMSHRTSKYVNGTLINVTASTITSLYDAEKYNSKIKINDAGFKSNQKSNKNTNHAKYKVSSRSLPKSIELKNVNCKNKPSKLKSGNSHKLLPIIDKKFSSIEFSNDECINVDEKERTLIDYKTTNFYLNRLMTSDNARDQMRIKTKKEIPKLLTKTTFSRQKQSTLNYARMPFEYSDYLSM